MQFALMIYHSPEEFDMRKNDYNHPHLGAWRAYYKALVEAGVYVGANALEVPETGCGAHCPSLSHRAEDYGATTVPRKNKNSQWWYSVRNPASG
jgi:hypothetical protein